MLRTASTLTLGLLVLTGCPGDDSGTTAAGSTTTTDDTTGPGTNPTGTTAPGTTDAATESADTTAGATTDPGTTTDSPGTTTDSPGTTDESGTTGPVDECSMCVEAECSEELADCLADRDCTCFQDCAAENPGPMSAMQCAEQCDVDLFGGVLGPLTQCTIANCNVCLG